MVTVEIEYCVPREFLSPALETERASLDDLGREVDSVALQPGHGGVFEIRVDEDIVRDEDVRGAELDLDLVVDAVQERSPVA